VRAADLEAIASAFPNLESLDLETCIITLDGGGCRAVLPRLRRLRGFCSFGLLEGGALRALAPALEALTLGSTYDLGSSDGWEGHDTLRELEIDGSPYFLYPGRDQGLRLNLNGNMMGWYAPDRTCLVDLGALRKLPALGSLRVGLAANLSNDVSPAELARGAASLRAWGEGWTRLRSLSIGGSDIAGAYFDAGGALPVLAERLGPHLKHLTLGPCSFVRGASEFASMHDCLAACLPRFVALESLAIVFHYVTLQFVPGASTMARLEDTYSELMHGLAAALAKPRCLWPPRLSAVRVQLPMGNSRAGVLLSFLGSPPWMRVEGYLDGRTSDGCRV
jgi:hypothetical protein